MPITQTSPITKAYVAARRPNKIIITSLKRYFYSEAKIKRRSAAPINRQKVQC
jgi:hypothetical protein